MFSVIVAGSRSFRDYGLLVRTMDRLLANKDPREVRIVSGAAPGADRLGERYACDNLLSLRLFPADWEGLGRKAGFVRNEAMAEYADALVAFWDGTSRGTAHMIRAALARGLAVRVVRFGPRATIERVHVVNMHDPGVQEVASVFKIDRTTPLGNPFPVSIGRQACVAQYRAWLGDQLRNHPAEEPALYFEELRRHLIQTGEIRLGCWCKPLPCHGDIIREFLLANVHLFRPKRPEIFWSLASRRAESYLGSPEPEGIDPKGFWGPLGLDQEVTPFPFEYDLLSEIRPRPQAGMHHHAWFRGSERAGSFFSPWSFVHGNSFTDEDEPEADHENEELGLFDHSGYGESQIAMAAHASDMTQLERLLFEACQLSTDGTKVMAPHENRQTTPKRFFVPNIQQRLKCSALEATDLVAQWLVMEATDPMVETFIGWTRTKGIPAALRYFGGLAATLAAEDTPPWDALERPLENLFQDQAPDYGTPRYIESEDETELFDILDFDESEDRAPNPVSFHTVGEYDEPDFIESAPTWFQDMVASVQEESRYESLLSIGKAAFGQKRLSGGRASVFWDAYNRKKAALAPKIEPGAVETVESLKALDKTQLATIGKTLYREQQDGVFNSVSWGVIWKAFHERQQALAA